MSERARKHERPSASPLNDFDPQPMPSTGAEQHNSLDEDASLGHSLSILPPKTAATANMEALAACAERVASTSARNEKIAIVAAYLETLSDDDLARAVLILSGTPFPVSDPRRLSVGHATLRLALSTVSRWDLETIATCYREVGDSGETIALLIRPVTRGESLTLAAAAEFYHRLEQSRRTAQKLEILTEVFQTYDWMAVKYFVKGITGNLRIGLQEKMVEEAVAQACGIAADKVRAVNNRSGDLARVALAARAGALETIEAALFHPIDFMLAKPLDDLADLADPQAWIVEDKYDGIRAQVHVADGKVRIFTRGLEETTASFPEVILRLVRLRGPAIIDGELLGWRDGRALPFNVLQQRIARKRVTQQNIDEIPVVFLGYDLIMHEGRLLLDAPIEERRKLLESLDLPLIAVQSRVESREEIEALFHAARDRGNEGLVLKREGSVYESGKRGGNWLKVKRPYATLDVVVTAVEQGHGRRASVLSDFTFAVRAGERFINVGKAYSGLTDIEIKELTRIFRAATLERFGRVHLVKPEVVLEVAFDGVQKSPRHKSGYALRFPRILHWRKDKQPSECDSLERVRELYERSLAAGIKTADAVDAPAGNPDGEGQ